MPARFALAVPALLLGGGLLAPALSPAIAQTTPNANEIVKSLTPTGDMSNSTRGIRIGNRPMAGATHAGAKAPSVSLSIEFATGSAELTPAAMQSLDQLGQALTTPTLASYHFRVEGHTDTVGSAAMNKSLSERRAEAVVNYLTSKYGIDASRLQAVGMGENGLLVATGPNTPEARNRRVLVVNVGS